jgi:hypothetical protein
MCCSLLHPFMMADPGKFNSSLQSNTDADELAESKDWPVALSDRSYEKKRLPGSLKNGLEINHMIVSKHLEMCRVSG